MKKKLDFNEVILKIMEAHPDFDRKDALAFFAYWAKMMIPNYKVEAMLKELKKAGNN